MKKIATIIVAVALTLTLMSCDILGKGKTSGSKWSKKMTVDGTNIEKTFRRFLSPLSSSRNVSEIKTTIAVDTTNSVLKADVNGEQKNAVVGLAFDFHKNATAKTYDFVLLGFAPETKKFYIERYAAVPYGKLSGKDATEVADIAEDAEDLGTPGFDTDEGSIADYVSFTGTIPNLKISDKMVANDWYAAPEGSYKVDGENGFEFYIWIKQDTKGKYEIYLGPNGEKKIGEYEGTVKDEETGKLCVGGAAVYANTPKGTKLSVKYISDKDETVGLFADAE